MSRASARAEQEDTPSRPIRTLFVSDLHLGCRHANTTAFLDLLDAFAPRRLYLVGDFIDGWKLRRRWRWDDASTRILRRIVDFVRRGGIVRYTPGNHDAFAREFLLTLARVGVADEFTHRTADGRRFLVTHGDRFDRIETGAPWMSVAATVAYDALLSANAWCHRLFGRRRARPYAFSAAVKRSVKGIVQYVSDFETAIAGHARRLGCDGVVCGHIHTPVIRDAGGLAYCNTGDWVEHCTAIVEQGDGRLDLIERTGPGEWTTLATSTSRRAGVEPCGLSERFTPGTTAGKPLHAESEAMRSFAHPSRPETDRWRGSSSAWPAKDAGTPRGSGRSPNGCAWSTS